MARAVWKYTLGPLHNSLAVPAGAQFLYATAQKGDVVAYALVDVDTEDQEIRVLHVVGTGHEELPDRELRPLGVALLGGGSLMFHVFEVL